MDLQEEAAGRQQFAETLRKVAGDQGRPAMVSSVHCCQQHLYGSADQVLCTQLKPASVGNKPVDLFLLWRGGGRSWRLPKVLDLPCSLSLNFLWIYLGSCTVLGSGFGCQ